MCLHRHFAARCRAARSIARSSIRAATHKNSVWPACLAVEATNSFHCPGILNARKFPSHCCTIPTAYLSSASHSHLLFHVRTNPEIADFISVCCFSFTASHADCSAPVETWQSPPWTKGLMYVRAHITSLPCLLWLGACGHSSSTSRCINLRASADRCISPAFQTACEILMSVGR